MKAHEPGIRRTRSGWQAYVRIDGEFRSKRFAPTTALTELRRWREQQKARHTLNLPTPASETGLARDVGDYLELVTYLVSYEDRQRRMLRWVQLLGAQTNRDDILSADIRRGLETLRRSGNKPATLNLYRTDLMHFFSVTNGRSGKNPVKDVPAYVVTPMRLTLPTWKQAEQVIADVDGLSQLRLRVLLWTGWPSAQLQRLTVGDMDLKHARVRVPGRKKGKGTADVTLPILPGAVAALKAFANADAWGAFNKDSLLKSLHRACKAQDVPAFRVYDLRHLFLTEAAKVIKDDRAVGALGQHQDLSTTKRYTEQSVDPRVQAGMAKFRRKMGAKVAKRRTAVAKVKKSA